MALWGRRVFPIPHAQASAVLRGRFMTAAARCYVTAIPMHMPAMKRLIRYAGKARLGLIRSKTAYFQFIARTGRSTINVRSFPRGTRPPGALAAHADRLYCPHREETFEEMAEKVAACEGAGAFRTLFDKLRAFDIPIGSRRPQQNVFAPVRDQDLAQCPQEGRVYLRAKLGF